MLFKKVTRHIKQNCGDMYTQALVCLSLFMVMLFFILQVSSVMTQKMWLDEQLNDIAKLVSINGTTETAEINEIKNNIIDRMGGDVIYECTYFDSINKTVQLGSVVKIKYSNEFFPVFKLSNHVVSIPIEVTRQAVGEVYHKP